MLSFEDEHIDHEETGYAASAAPAEPQPETERKPAAYGSANMPPDTPEEPVPYGTEIDEEWFSGDTEYWDERAEELEAQAVAHRRWPRWARALVAVCVSAALIVLMVIPFGGLAEFADVIINGIPSTSNTETVVFDAGSPANFYIQRTFDFPKKAKSPALEGAAALPKYFLTNTGEVTTVKLQSPWQDCWAFAGVAALESAVLKARKAGDSEGAAMDEPQLKGLPAEPDYSERHVAWFAHEVESEAAAGTQAGEGLSFAERDNATQLTGGSLLYTDAQFTTSKGIVSESDEPYCYEGYSEGDMPFYQLGRSKGDNPAPGDRQDARNRDWSLGLQHVQDSNGVLVKSALMLPSPVKTKQTKTGQLAYAGYDKKATAAIKNALVTNGAVAFSCRADVSKPGMELLSSGSGEHFSYDTWAQYDNTDTPRTNHAACIVGWDDTYSAQNFSGTVSGSPPADGAWLVKNSWGSEELYRQLGVTGLDVLHASNGIDRSGFFWLSYYDHTIATPYAFGVELSAQAAKMANVYQYDYLAVKDAAVPLKVSPAPQVANVFEVQADQELYAVSARTYEPGSKVHVSVVRLNSASDDPDDGTKLASLSAVCDYGGFHELELDEPVSLKAGERFAVVEQVSGPADDAQGYLNLETVAYESSDTTKATVIANEGETYARFGDGGAWMTPRQARDKLSGDGVEIAALGNAMVKAYTR